MEIDNRSLKTKKLTTSSIVIALYVVIMFLTQSFSFGAVQIRIATTLYALAYLCPFLVLPLGLSNVISNILLGGLGIFDILGGGLVGVITSILICLIRKFKLNICFVAIPIILIPGLLVPIWLSQILVVPYKVLAISLCLGQVVPAILGVILIKTFKGKIGE